MPRVIQTPSPNYSNTPISHDKIFMHMMEGGCAGSVAWLCDHRAGASSHLCMSEDGLTVYQLVPLGVKAWAQCAYNSQGVSIEMPGFTAQGIPDDRWRAGARIAAWLCHAYGIPPTWAKGGQGRGVCCHHDLGAAGGGHVDCCGVGDAAWMKFMGFLGEEYAALAEGRLPPFALHGVPNPAQVELPPNVPPTPSHGGAARGDPADVAAPAGSMRDVQSRLRRAGANPSLGVDGIDGPATEAALATFQRANGLPATGRMSPATWAVLAKAAARALA
jgi:hypothetical protein